MGCLMTNAVPVDAVLLSVLPAYLLSPIYSIPRYVYVCTVAHYHTSCGLWESQGLDITLNCWVLTKMRSFVYIRKPKEGPDCIKQY